MQLTVFSLIAGILWSSFLIIAIWWFRKFIFFKQYFGLMSIIALYLSSGIRMFLAIEMPGTIVIESDKVYTAIYDFLSYPVCQIRDHEFVLYQLLIFIWGIGSFLLFAVHIQQNKKIWTMIKEYSVPASADDQKLLQDIQKETGTEIKTGIYTYPYIFVPVVIGLREKRILLPIQEYTRQELYYILKHEYVHFQKHDLWMKALVSIFCILFWWNPVVYLLKKDLETTLEMKCDLCVVENWKKDEVVSYLQGIKELARKNQFCSEELKERFQAILIHSKKKKQRKFPFFLCWLGFAILFFLSYTFLPQPVYEAPAIQNEFDATNAYLKKSSEGRYELYVEGIFQGSVSDEMAVLLKNSGFKVKEEEEEK